LPHESTVSVISYGGGVQSTALVVLAAQGNIPHKVALFCNVGDDSENPDTLVYVREHVIPWAAERGVEVRELHRVRRNGQSETLMERINRSESSVPIPMRMTNGAPGNRQCTGDFKIAVVAKELRRMGATKDNPANVALGISIDEYQRMRTSNISYEVLDYPLIDLRLDRAACQQIIADAGLPPAPKSACYFCPFQSRAQWQRLRIDKPELFALSVALEQRMNERRAKLGKDAVWMTSSAKPLDEAVVDTGQLEMFSTCDIAGYCHV
jgi:hypothetical protein